MDASRPTGEGRTSHSRSSPAEPIEAPSEREGQPSRDTVKMAAESAAPGAAELAAPVGPRAGVAPPPAAARLDSHLASHRDSGGDPGSAPHQATGDGARTSLASLASLTGQTIERYTVEALIGKGGMGEVYRAVDGRLRRKVALKVLRPDKDRPDAVARLFREARAAAALTHPNVVAIHDIGESGGIFYIVMELVSGMPLLAYVGDERISLARKLRWLTDVARALACAHKAGVIHRDVKPSNIMVSEDDVAKVLDFGLAKPIEPKSVDFQTQIGRVVGTVRYMAPEQLAGAEAHARSDQYALAVTAYEVLSGRYPEGHRLGVHARLEAIVPGFPKDGGAVIARMMRRDPEERFPSMNDVVTALEDLANQRPPRVPLPPDTVLTAAGEERKSFAPMADTVREPGAADASDGPPAGSPAAPAALAATLPAAEGLVQRQAAHARAHEAVRTLLSREAPPEIAQLRAAPPGGATKRLEKMRRADKGPSAPPTLVSGPVAGAPPPARPAPPATPAPVRSDPPPAPPNVAPSAGPAVIPPLPTTSRTPPARPGSTLPLVIVVIVAILAAAVFAGTYFGARARAPGVLAPEADPTAPPQTTAPSEATAPSNAAAPARAKRHRQDPGY